MPETRKERGHVLTTQHSIKLVQEINGGAPLCVVDLWADYTNKEAAKEGVNTPARRGYVDRIGPGSKLERGPKSNQKRLYPPILRQQYLKSRKKLTSTELLKGLQVQGPQSISGTDRSMVVDLGGVILQVQYLLHTSPQLYSSEQWDVIKRVHKNDRAFKVGLTIEFETHVLAFTTKDLLFKVFSLCLLIDWSLQLTLAAWWTSMDDIDQLPNVFHDYPQFLEAMAAWIEEEFMNGNGDRSGVKLAFTAFRG
ncbi:hypothetical protein PM082_020386 [Marasmius tenuissimus]|nr:hypothetical protein PM082_020386 [Marasmius tenuissimus]